MILSQFKTKKVLFQTWKEISWQNFLSCQIDIQLISSLAMINPISENFTLVSTTKDTLFNLLKNFKVTIGQQFSKN